MTRRDRLGVRLASLACLVATALGGCRTADPYADARIESEIKARLVAEKSANLTRLGVLCQGGTVYLSGAVASEAQRGRAEAIARDVPGVRRVVNSVAVRSGAASDASALAAAARPEPRPPPSDRSAAFPP